MFAAVMMQEDNCKRFLEMLLDIEILEVKVSYEKCMIYNPEYKGVRLDVYAADEKNTRYDIEMQIAAQHLGKRARYYHSQMDMDILECGHEYKELPETYVIFICDFDPFGLGKYCYTFENRCLQEFTLPMGDFSRSIFLSTKGKDADSIPKELKSFLDFIRQDTPENNTKADDAYVKVLQKAIRRVKDNRELERSFMTLDEYRQWGREEGRAEGREEGREEGIVEGMLRARREDLMELMQELGDIPEALKDRIMSEADIDVLKSMLKVVRTVTSIEEFNKQITNL